MPKSKRAKVIHMTKVQKKDKDDKAKLFTAIRDAADKYAHIFVFGVEHMRNTYLKNVRTHFSDSRIFFGKTKVMAKALGQSEAEEYQPGLAKLAELLEGSVGLLFTDRDVKAVLEYFETYSEMDFARAGVEAMRDVVVPAGVVYSRAGEVPVEDDVPLPHSLEVTLRKWGMATRLDKGKVTLDAEHRICRTSETLNSHQTALLKLFGITMAEFRVQIKAYWDRESQDVTVVEADGAMEED